MAEASTVVIPLPPRAAARGALLRKNSLASAFRAGSTSLSTVLLPIVLVIALPESTYAVWALTFSIAAFTLYFDLGAQAAVLALVGRAEAAGDRISAVAAGRAGVRVAASVGTMAVIVGFGLALSLGTVFPAIARSDQGSAGATLVLLFVGQGLNLVATALASYFGGRQQTGSATAILVPARFGSMVLTAAAAFAGGGLVVLGVAFVLPIAAGTALLGARFWRDARSIGYRRASGHVGVAHLLRFSGTLILWNLCMLVVSGLDLTVVGRVDFAHLAVYSIASTVAVGIAGLDNALIAPLLPELSGRVGRGDTVGAGGLLERATRMNAILLGGVVATVAAAAPLLASVLLTSADLSLASAIVVVLTVANCLRLVVAPLSLGFVARGTHTRLVVQPLMETAANLTASLTLGVLFGAVGVAFGTLIGSVVGVTTALTWSVAVAGRGLVSRRNLLRHGLGVPALAWAPAFLALAYVWASGRETDPAGVAIAAVGVVLSLPIALHLLGPSGRAPFKRLLPVRLR